MNKPGQPDGLCIFWDCKFCCDRISLAVIYCISNDSYRLDKCADCYGRPLAFSRIKLREYFIAEIPMSGFEREMDVVTLGSSKSDCSSGWGSFPDDDDMFNVTGGSDQGAGGTAGSAGG